MDSLYPSGVYAIVNIVNDHRYIGSSIDLKRRRYEHLAALQKGIHHNPYLQAAFNHYGAPSFIFVMLEHVSDCSKLVEREQHFIDTQHPEYNILLTAGSHLGAKRPPETGQRISAAKTGFKFSQASKEKMRAAKVGRTLSSSHRIKIGAAQKGRIVNKEEIERMTNVTRGKSLSKEHRAKLSAAKKGKPGTRLGTKHSDASRKKMSESAKHRCKKTD